MAEFEFTYSAPDQEEIRRIRQKYIPPEENKLEKLRRLDAGVTRPGTVMGLVLGILGCLVLGTGMSCCLVWGGSAMVPGIVVGILGMIMMGLAYPVSARITRRQRERLAPEILRLTEELLQ